jgi:hypothetical protein
MGLAVHGLHVLGSRGSRKAESGATCFVEPVREKRDAISILNLEIPGVRVGHVRGRLLVEIVPIHVKRHLRST